MQFQTESLPKSVNINSRGRILADTNSQASAVLAVGALLWKFVSVWSDIDFLLTIREEKFAVFFDLLQSVGWIALVIIGAVWFLVRWLTRGSAEPHRAPTWSMVAACTIIAFLFGVLIAVRSSGGVPHVIASWGNTPNSCHAVIDTSRLLSFRDKYKLGLACGLTDPTLDKLEDERISVSNPFEIIPGAVNIVVLYREEMAKRFPDSSRMWFEPLLIPNGVSTAKIAKLSDLLKMNGKIIRPQYFR
jgi:hypothetical protein